MDLMEIIKIPAVWEPDFSKQLNDAELTSKEIPFPFIKDINQEFDIFQLSFNADVKGKTTIYNDKDDKDDLGNFIEAPFPAIGINNAMIRYDLNIKLKEAVSGAFKRINVNFLSAQDILISYYKIHTNTNTLQQALIQDIVSFKTLYSGEDIFSLAANEGLAVKINATLDAGLNLAFSDIFSWTLSQLVKILPKGTAVAGTASARASFSFSVKISDKFKLFIQKSEGDMYKVSINKATSHSSIAALHAGINASIDETDERFAEFMNHILSALMGEPIEKVNKWIEQGISSLPDLEKLLLLKVMTRMGIDIDHLNEELIKSHYDDLKTSIIDKAKVILSKKLELGVSLEYQKAIESNAFFNAVMTSKAVKDNLKEILLFKIDNLEEKEGVTINNYIFSRKESISKKFGFRFTFGNFNAYWFNQKKFVFEENKNVLLGIDRKSFSGQKIHLQGGINNKQWHFNFSGEMKNSAKHPKMDDFEYSSIVHWEDQEKKTKAEELADFVEMGIIWNCINIPFDEACKKIYQEIKDKRDVKFSCEIKIPAPEMNFLIPELAKTSINDIILSLCASMPHRSNTYRKQLIDLFIYFAVWKIYFEDKGDGNSNKWAVLCYKQLEHLFPDLAKWERSFEKGITTIQGQQSYQSFVGLTENSGLFDDIISFQKGIKNLHDAIQNKNDYSEDLIENIFNKIDNLVTSSGQNKTFNITFLGRYLLNVAQKLDLDENIISKMTIGYVNNQGDNIEMSFMVNR
jgi:hypothetical protein